MNLRQISTMATVAVAAAAVTAVVTLSITRASGQQSAGNTKPAPATRPARIDGKPNMSGIWQALNEANWDVEAHAARSGAVTQAGVYPFEYARVPAAPVVALGAAAGVPASLGVVQDDGKIPYKPESLATKNENVEHWIDRDPELKCYLPGIPRAMYLPYPFEITQGTSKVADVVRVHEHGADDSSRQGGGSAGRYLDGPLGRPLGRRHARRQRQLVQRQDLVRSGGQFPQRRAPCHRAVLAADARCDLVRGDDRRPQRLHAPLANRHAALPPHGAEHAAARVSVHPVRRGVPVREPAQDAARDALGRRNHVD